MIRFTPYHSTNWILFLIGFLFITLPGIGQREYDLLGKGARAAGMAYAFTAIADDATAITWNPGGIVQIKKPELAFANSLTFTKYQHEFMDYNYRPIYTVDYLGFVYPLKIKKKDLVFGASYQNRMNYKYSYENLPSQNGRDNGKKTLTVNSISLCGAYSLNRFVGIGVSFNRWFSLGNKAHDSSLYYTKVLYNDSTYPDEMVYDYTEQYNYSGNNFTMGILVDFSSLHFPLRFAVRYDSRFALKDIFDYTSDWKHVHYDKNDTTWSDHANGTRSWDFPAMLTGGLSYRFGDYLTVSGDIEFKLYKNNLESWDYRYKYIRSTDGIDTILTDTEYHIDSTFQHEKSILNQYRIGLEYILHPSFALIPVRAGWKINPTSLNTYDKNGTAVKLVLAHSINLGTGLALKHIALDLAYEAYWYDRKDENYRNEKKAMHCLALSVIWYIK
jgi:long-chain fatty acid transport protein